MDYTSKMKVHHIGIIVDCIEKNIEIYRQLGYNQSSEIVQDNNQHIRVVFLDSSDMKQKIELIESLGDVSSIHNFKTGYHHICYDVSEKKDFFELFNELKIGRIFTEPMVAPAISNRQIIFSCLYNGTFIEFIL